MQVARPVAVALLLLAAGCGERDTAPDNASIVSKPSAVAAASPPNVTSTSSNPLLGRPAVQDAIRRALKTGENQRWEDGGLSGYAVPSLTALANGCRTVRYTVDQRPDEPMMMINACDASR
jgi:hypothetical protein